MCQEKRVVVQTFRQFCKHCEHRIYDWDKAKCRIKQSKICGSGICPIWNRFIPLDIYRQHILENKEVNNVR